MAGKKRRDKDGASIKLKQPDRSAPTDQTLLQLAQERNLFQEAEMRQRSINRKPDTTKVEGEQEEEEAPISPQAERIMETVLWTVSLSMLHFTLDVLVQHQYAVDWIDWWKVSTRAGQAFLVFSLLFYNLHPHHSSPTLLPGLPARYQTALRQTIFFAMSVGAGCYLIHVSNRYGYLAVMKRAPPIGCLWIWSVIELDLALAVLSLGCAGVYMWQGGYSYK